MDEISNSKPTHPVITFQVDLSTVNQYSSLTPDQYQNSPDRGRTYTANQANNRSTLIPGLSLGDNRALHHGDQFTLYGVEAQYYRAEIKKGNFPMLRIIDEN